MHNASWLAFSLKESKKKRKINIRLCVASCRVFQLVRLKAIEGIGFCVFDKVDDTLCLYNVYDHLYLELSDLLLERLNVIWFIKSIERV